MLYNEKMIKLTIEKNDENQRLDRFLKKYYGKASLSFIYKMIRKDVKINGKRGKAETVLHEGDQLQVYLSDEDGEALRTKQKTYRTKRQFEIAYEDEDLLIVEKPFGLLTHGDAVEKKNTLANQVCGYLMSKGEYSPGREQTFVPAPVNRLDRNTTGLVIFGKNAATVKEMNQMIRERGQIQKKYLTIVAGNLTKPIELKDKMIKDENRNVVEIVGADQEGKVMETIATPLKTTGEYTLVEVELVTGRTHQIRVHLSEAGFPIIGDVKYGNKKVNSRVKQKYGLATQLLNAHTLRFNGGKLAGTVVESKLPDNFLTIKKDIFG